MINIHVFVYLRRFVWLLKFDFLILGGKACMKKFHNYFLWRPGGHKFKLSASGRKVEVKKLRRCFKILLWIHY